MIPPVTIWHALEAVMIGQTGIRPLLVIVLLTLDAELDTDTVTVFSVVE